MSIDFTTVVGVDEKHAGELELVWPTWRAHRPELLARPLLLICDGAKSAPAWERRLRFVDHPAKQIVLWNRVAATQREKMLSGLVFAAAEHVQTPWYLKIDTDAVSLRTYRWIDEAWFEPIEGRPPAIVASPWAYTKPADWIPKLDDWGDGVDGLRDRPRLELVPQPGAVRLRHPRIISWLMFGQTAFLKRVADWCGGRLPVASQDTVLWYCATRAGVPVRKVRMSAYGWTHGAPRRILRRTEEGSSPT